MKNINFKSITPHLIIFVVFILLTLIFFGPLLSGKDLRQQDMMNTSGMIQELKKYKEQTGEVSQWTNSMFSGMPSYQIMGSQDKNVFMYLFSALKLNLPYGSIAILFVYLISFYLLLVSLRLNPWISLVGSIAFSFASYNIIIIEVGHITKAYAIGLIPMVMAGILKIMDEKYLVGLVLTALGLGIQLYANHIQITYYMFMMLAVIMICFFADAVKQKQIASFAKKCGFIAAGAILAILPNLGTIWTTYEYGKYTLRGKSDLTSQESSNKGGGLDKDYAFGWSYGVAETGTLLIPGFMGGSNGEDVGKNSETYKALESNGAGAQAGQISQNVPLYWGDQPFVAGPVYFGAIVCFLFVLGLFLVKGPLKWGLLLATIMSIMLSWGKNFPALNDFLFYNFPFYNKFRTVSMMLVIAGFTMPFLGFLGLKELLSAELTKEQKLAALKKSLLIVGIPCLLFALVPGIFFDFIASSDEQMAKGGYPEWLITAIRSDREGFLRSDAFRSLIFVLLSGGALWAYAIDKLKAVYLYAVLGILMLVDFVPVDKRYLSKEDFAPKREVAKVFDPTPADLEIMKDTDPHYRVYNVTVNPFADATTSFFHKSIGGYHGAKLRRYQELYDATIAKGNTKALDMLNAKYFIVPGPDKQPMAQRNPNALGNAWFVNSYKIAANADEELKVVSTLDPKTEAVIDKKYEADVKGVENNSTADSLSTDNIKLTSYKPNELVYESNVSKNRLAVFSEVYYEKGWNAYVDGQLKPHVRANYTLRAMVVPAGKHKIEFKFEPKSYAMGQTISMIGSIIIVLLIVFVLYLEFFKNKTAAA